MARLVTKISHDAKADPNCWVLTVENTDEAEREPIAYFPCVSETQAELFETQIGNLLAHLGGSEE